MYLQQKCTLYLVRVLKTQVCEKMEKDNFVYTLMRIHALFGRFHLPCTTHPAGHWNLTQFPVDYGSSMRSVLTAVKQLSKLSLHNEM